jgi:ADP-dependent NAD(P)H-hydrate dehydratase
MLDIDETCALLEQLLPALSGTVVIDALGLAAVGADPACLHHLGGRAVLTPNISELALTLAVDEATVEADPGGCAARLAAQVRAVVVSGGGESWTAAPDGRRWCAQTGSAGLGVSGSGDVLAGVVAGLAARGASPDQAAVWATYVHGSAGDRLAATVGRIGYLAREIPAALPGVFAEIEA